MPVLSTEMVLWVFSVSSLLGANIMPITTPTIKAPAKELINLKRGCAHLCLAITSACL